MAGVTLQLQPGLWHQSWGSPARRLHVVIDSHCKLSRAAVAAPAAAVTIVSWFVVNCDPRFDRCRQCSQPWPRVFPRSDAEGNRADSAGCSRWRQAQPRSSSTVPPIGGTLEPAIAFRTTTVAAAPPTVIRTTLLFVVDGVVVPPLPLSVLGGVVGTGAAGRCRRHLRLRRSHRP